MCRSSRLLLVSHPRKSAVTSALLMSLSACHTSCLSPYFSCCVCRKSMNTIILLFAIAFGTIVSMGFGFYLSPYHRPTCSSLKRQHLPEWRGNCLNGDRAFCYPLNKTGCGRGLQPWLGDQLAHDLGLIFSSPRVSCLGPVQIFNSVSTHRRALPRSGTIFKWVYAFLWDCSCFYFKTFHFSSCSTCKNNTSNEELIFCDLWGI